MPVLHSQRASVPVQLSLLLVFTACQGESVLRSSGTADGHPLSTLVHPCSEGPSERSPRLTDFEYRAEGDALFVKHTLTTYCNAVPDRALSFTASVGVDRIEIVERFDGEAVRCTCRFPVAVEIGGLDSGRYALTLTYRARIGGEVQEPETLWEGEVVVR